MTLKRRTISEVLYPAQSAEFGALAELWSTEVTTGMLELVWRAYDLFINDLDSMGEKEFIRDSGSIERNITQMLERRIHRCSTRYEPYTAQHEAWEHEGWLGGKSRPKQYDIAFVWNANERIMWPVEAKVLQNESDLGEYLGEIFGNFEQCHYGPFSNGGAMAAYLLRGLPEQTLEILEKRLGIALIQNQNFQSRPHKISQHLRVVPVGKNYVSGFQCQHLILDCTGCVKTKEIG